MGKEFDIVALGELLIDFTEVGVKDHGIHLFEQNPGGAPANLLTVASHMGYKTAMIGKVGEDMHGEFLINILKKENISTEHIVRDSNYFTTLAFVAINEAGEREFSFARKPGADTQLQVSDLNTDVLQHCRIFHFGSLSLTDIPARKATIEAIQIAKRAGALISYDPNYRASLWENEKKALEQIKSVIKYVDIMKVSDEESELLTGENDYQCAAEKIMAMGPKLIAITLGSEGAFVCTNSMSVTVPAIVSETVDTTGAGDSFWGGFLSKYLDNDCGLLNMGHDDIVQCLKYGNATAALCVRKRGGIPAIPSKEDVEELVYNAY